MNVTQRLKVRTQVAQPVTTEPVQAAKKIPSQQVQHKNISFSGGVARWVRS